MNKEVRLYLISGKARHGKDTFSGFLSDVYKENGKKVIITQLSSILFTRTILSFMFLYNTWKNHPSIR